MVTGSLARRYARAVVEIGTEHGNLDKLGADLRALATAMHDSAELVTVLTNPAIRRADRRREVDAMIEARAGRMMAEVTSARPLDAAQLTQITTALEKLSGKKVTVTKHEDPDLLGGVVAKLGDTVYDGSLRTQLRTLRDELTK